MENRKKKNNFYSFFRTVSVAQVGVVVAAAAACPMHFWHSFAQCLRRRPWFVLVAVIVTVNVVDASMPLNSIILSSLLFFFVREKCKYNDRNDGNV